MAAKKLPRKRIVEEVKTGALNPTEAARKYGCSRSTIYDILKAFDVQRDRLESYKKSRADILADLGIRSTELLHKLLKKAGREKALDKVPPGQVAGLIATATTLMGVAYDKERLERGQSTANVQSLLLVAQQRADELDKV